MFEMILPDSMFRDLSKKSHIYEVLDDFFASDVFTEDEYEEKKHKVLEALKDEPELLELIREDL